VLLPTCSHRKYEKTRTFVGDSCNLVPWSTRRRSEIWRWPQICHVGETRTNMRQTITFYTVETKQLLDQNKPKTKQLLGCQGKPPPSYKVFYLCKYRAKVSAYYEDRTDDLCRKLSGVLSQTKVDLLIGPH
jgi:hypothetical protein